MKQRPLILITNDDSIEAPGLRARVDVAVEIGDVVVAAPSEPMSGQSSAITVTTPLRIREHDSYRGAKMYSVNGTPVDCVKLALHALFDRKPDLLLSGINHGSNSGNSIVYSGTMGAVIEGCMVGIPSIGYSLLDHSHSADFSESQPWIRQITSAVADRGLANGICLNVNIPAGCRPEGVKVVRAALGRWTEEYVDYTDPMGRPFYLLTGRFLNEEPDADDTDEYWLKRGYVTVVPVKTDMSATEAISAVEDLII